MKLKKIHRVMSFTESDLIRPYIDFNTQNRREATSHFLQTLLKNMNNMLFGKTMENTRKRLDLHVTTRAETAKKLIARPKFKRFDIINEDLTVNDLQKNEVLMDKPLYLGFCILELSKLTMYCFHYKEMIGKYGKRVKLRYIDTDSFIYKIETENLYNDLALNFDAYDTSDYPPDHPLYSRTNTKVL